MAVNITLEELQQYAIQLSAPEQLKLVSRICENLNMNFFLKKDGNGIEENERTEKNAEELLALCDAAADLWEGEFDAAEEIRQMRLERDK